MLWPPSLFPPLPFSFLSTSFLASLPILPQSSGPSPHLAKPLSPHLVVLLPACPTLPQMERTWYLHGERFCKRIGSTLICSHSFLRVLHFLSMFFNDPCQHSSQPSVCGQYGDVLSHLTSRSRHSCLVRRPMKTEPWSVNISSSNPSLEKISIMASATVSASTLRNVPQGI